MIIKFIKIIIKEQPLRFFIIITALVISGLLEGLGVALFVPLLEMIGTKDQVFLSNGKVAILLKTFFEFIGIKLTLGTVLSSILILIFMQQLTILFQQTVLFKSMNLFEKNVREGLFDSFLNSSWSFFLKNKIGNLTNALTVEAARAGQAYYALNLMISVLVIIVIYVAIALTISWQMAVIAFSIGFLVFGFLRKRVNKASLFGTEITQANTNLQNEANEQISGAKLVKGYSAESVILRRFSKYLDTLFKYRLAYYLNQAWLKSIFDFSMAFILCAGIFVAITYFKMSIANLIVFLFIFYRLAPRLSNFQSLQHAVLLDLPALNQIDELKNTAVSMKESSGQVTFKGMFNEINLKKVSFSYEDNNKILSNITLSVPSGKMIAFVGGSGAGKSTIIDLLVGLLKPNKGEILIDNVPLSAIDMKSWRDKIGYVTQETILFHDTISANIAWGNPDVKQNEIISAAKTAFADEFIKQLPNKYDTIIGDRGIRLSGGQRQRIALARALIRKPQLLILDEATNALDAESEQKIQKAIERLSGSITIVFVTHRLSTVKKADMIFVLENGTIVEKGGWNELVLSKGRFDHLKQLQVLD